MKNTMTDKHYKYDIVADKIIALIVKGEYSPGDRLPSEGELTKMFAVSRVTLRESLKKLSMMGVVSIVQGSGTYVEEVTPAKFMRPLFPLLIFNGGNIKDVYNFRLYSERGACELAARFRSADDLRRMGNLIELMEEAVRQRDFERYSDCDKEFHAAIHQASKNEIMVIINNLFRQFIDGYFKTVNNSADIVNQSLRDHRLIFDAIDKGQKDLASVLMHEHLKKAKNDIMNILGLPEAP